METESARCWWCREATNEDDLVHLEGARLVGSRPLALPSRLSERERLELRVCRYCALAFADARKRHDVELAEGRVLPGGTSGPTDPARSMARFADALRSEPKEDQA